MADPYATIDQATDGLQQALAAVLEARATEPSQIAMRRSYLGDVALPAGARAADLGSGTGHLARDLVEVYGCAEVLGLDFSPVLVSRARELHGDLAALTFKQGDARATGLPDAHFDLVVLHTVLCHVPGPEAAVAEAFRILKPGGTIAVFDGDYDTGTVAITENDPLDAVVQRFVRGHVHDLWLTRRFGPLLQAAGFEVEKSRGHSYLAEGEAPYFRSVVNRGADLMVQLGTLAPAAAEALKSEADRRIADGTFFGFMSYLSVLATKPDTGSQGRVETT